MTRGYVDEKLQAKAPIALLDKNAEQSSLDGVVDTGFVGDLCISIHEVPNMDLTFSHEEKFMLANGEIIKQDVYLGKVIFDKRLVTAKVVVSTSRDTLIGAFLLADKKLDIDYPRRSVVIRSSKPRKKK